MENTGFIVLNVIRQDKDKQEFTREETIPMSDIKMVRKWHNTGREKSVPQSQEMSGVILKSPIVDENDETTKLFKLKVANSYESINRLLGAVKAD